MSLLLSVFQISKSFAGKEVFSGISFGINENERVALLGPNGVGKSTLIKILAKFFKPDSGDVVYRKGLKIEFLDQSPQFNDGDTIASYLLNNHDLEPHRIAKAYEWIGKLNLSQFGEDQIINQLSGGWRKKVALAKTLLNEPDLLFLDEPTNHLDIESIRWLENLLKSSKFSSFIITHDRIFLQRVAERILDLDPRFPQKILSINGGYEKYLETKAQMISDQLSTEKKLANNLRREKEWLARGAQARQTKQKFRQDSAYELENRVNELSQLNKPKEYQIEFQRTDKVPNKLVQLIKASKYQFNNKELFLFEEVTLNISSTTRLALLGQNGVGKSTLIQIILGNIKPEFGEVKIYEELKVAYFEQGRESLQVGKSILKNICPEGDYVNFQGTHLHVRSYLDKFGFSKEKVDLPVSQLSGGEQARLRIAQIMLQECHILVLDEPTNDLDIETLNVLEAAINEFKGAVIIVTHDRYFMDQVCNQLLAFPNLDSKDKHLTLFANSLQWENWLDGDQKDSLLDPNLNSASSEAAKLEGGKKLSYKEKFELENMEANISTLESEITQIQLDLSDQKNAANAGKLNDLYLSLNSKQKDLDSLYSRWVELEKKIKK